MKKPIVKNGNYVGKHPRLCVWSFALAFAVVWLIGVILLVVATFVFPTATSGLTWFTEFYGRFIPGTTTLLAAVYGLLDCFFFGLLLAVFYNIFRRKN